jgi:hypothetical protein
MNNVGSAEDFARKIIHYKMEKFCSYIYCKEYHLHSSNEHQLVRIVINDGGVSLEYINVNDLNIVFGSEQSQHNSMSMSGKFHFILN